MLVPTENLLLNYFDTETGAFAPQEQVTSETTISQRRLGIFVLETASRFRTWLEMARPSRHHDETTSLERHRDAMRLVMPLQGGWLSIIQHHDS